MTVRAEAIQVCETEHAHIREYLTSVRAALDVDGPTWTCPAGDPETYSALVRALVLCASGLALGDVLVDVLEMWQAADHDTKAASSKRACS